MARTSLLDGINLAVDVRRFRPLTVALMIAISTIVGLAVSAVNNNSRDGVLVRQAIITPTPTDGVDVELNVVWEDIGSGGYLNGNFGLETSGLTISDLTGSTAAGDARLRTDTDADGIPTHYEIDLPWIDGGVTQGNVRYRVDSGSGRFTAIVAGYWGHTPYIIDIVGAELSAITCETVRNDSVKPCRVAKTAPGVYHARVTNAPYGENVVISADVGAAVADANVDLIAPPRRLLPNDLQTPLVAALFAALTGLWIWWAVRRGSNEYRDRTGNLQTLSDRQLVGLAEPTLALPTDIDPPMARALANERISRMIVVTYIADLMRRRVLTGRLHAPAKPAAAAQTAGIGAVEISLGPRVYLASTFDQIAVNALLPGGDPHVIGIAGARQFIRAAAQINHALTEQVGELDWWRRGNPGSHPVPGISMWWLIPWFITELALMVAEIATRGLINLGVMIAMGVLFVGPTCYLLVIRRLLPSLSAAGSARLVEIESLRQGLTAVSEQQVTEMARTATLNDYAAWSVALNVTRLDDLVTELARRYPNDSAFVEAAPITRCVRNITRAGVGIAIQEVRGGVIRWNLNGAGRRT